MARRLLFRIAMGYPYEKGDVYRRAMNFAERIYRFADELPKAQWVLADQFKQAAMSISLIRAEGNGSWHPKERMDFFLITRGSAFDCVPLLELCRRRKLIDETECMKLEAELDTLARMLTRLVRGPKDVC